MLVSGAYGFSETTGGAADYHGNLTLFGLVSLIGWCLGTLQRETDSVTWAGVSLLLLLPPSGIIVRDVLRC